MLVKLNNLLITSHLFKIAIIALTKLSSVGYFPISLVWFTTEPPGTTLL